MKINDASRHNLSVILKELGFKKLATQALSEPNHYIMNGLIYIAIQKSLKINNYPFVINLCRYNMHD